MFSSKTLAVLTKIESAYAQDASPTGSANWTMLYGLPEVSPLELEEEELDIIMPFFGNQDSLIGSKTGKLKLKVLLGGSGAAATPPQWGVQMRACGISENILASAVTGTAQVGGGANGIKLAAAASANDNFYNGYELTVTAGTGSGNKAFIQDYDGTSKIASVITHQAAWTTDATSVYSIAPGVAYRPAYQNLEAVTHYLYISGRLHKFVGCRGNFSAMFETQKGPVAEFDYNGLYVPVTDASLPNIIMTAWRKPIKLSDANTPVFSFHGSLAIGLESLTLDCGNQIDFSDLVNGQDEYIITDRKSRAQVSIEDVPVATLNIWDRVVNATPGAIAIAHGLTSGNKLGFMAGNTTLKKPAFGTRNNLRTNQYEALLNTQSGSDEWAILSY